MIMPKIVMYALALTLIILSCNVRAEESIKLQLLAGLPKPPYIMKENGAGLQLEIIRESLALSNVEVEFIHMPLGRQINSYRQLMLDGIITLPIDYQGADVYLSAPYVNYQNVAISLASNDFRIDDISDLTDKSILAFQNASLFLGDFYKQLTAKAPYYEEIADQSKQMRSLYEQKVQIVIADINIYKYFIKENRDGIYHKATSVHQIFSERPYAIGFRDEAMSEKFSSGLMALKQSGKYQSIIDKYIGKP